MAAKKRTWHVARQSAEMQQWIDRVDNQQRLRDDPSASVRLQLLRRRYDSMGLDLGCLAVWYGGVGGVEVLQGNPQGWATLTRALAYRCWEIKFQLWKFEEDERAVYSLINVNEAANCLAHALAIGWDDYAYWLARKLIFSMKGTAFGSWQFSPYAPFIVQLCARWKNIHIEFPATGVAKLGLYQDIFAAWENPPALADAISAACDYHLSRLRKENNEFSPYPYNVFPAEILALCRVRRLQNLETREVEHPLMNTPLAQLSNEVPEVHDELLDQVIVQLTEDCPGI